VTLKSANADYFSLVLQCWFDSNEQAPKRVAEYRCRSGVSGPFPSRPQISYRKGLRRVSMCTASCFLFVNHFPCCVSLSTKGRERSPKEEHRAQRGGSFRAQDTIAGGSSCHFKIRIGLLDLVAVVHLPAQSSSLHSTVEII
jgi:hypothetical protein